jgi:hypothetical protein
MNGFVSSGVDCEMNNDLAAVLDTLRFTGAHGRDLISVPSVRNWYPQKTFVEGRHAPIVSELLTRTLSFREVSGPRGAGKSHCLAAVAEEINYGRKTSDSIAIPINCYNIENSIGLRRRKADGVERSNLAMLISLAFVLEIVAALKRYEGAARVKGVIDLFESRIGADNITSLRRVVNSIFEKIRGAANLEDAIVSASGQISGLTGPAIAEPRTITDARNAIIASHTTIVQTIIECVKDQKFKFVYLMFDDFSETTHVAREELTGLFGQIINYAQSVGLVCNIRVFTYWGEGVHRRLSRLASNQTPIGLEPYSLFFASQEVAPDVADVKFGEFHKSIFENRCALLGVRMAKVFPDLERREFDNFFVVLSRIAGTNVRETANVLSQMNDQGKAITIDNVLHECSINLGVYQERLYEEVYRLSFEAEAVASFFERFPSLLLDEIIASIGGGASFMCAHRFLVCDDHTKRLLRPLVNFGALYHVTRLHISKRLPGHFNLDLVAVSEAIRQRVPKASRPTSSDSVLFDGSISSMSDEEMIEKSKALNAFLDEAFPRSHRGSMA